MAERPVIIPAMPFPGQFVRQPDRLGDLEHRVPLVGQPQRLIVNVFVEVALFLEHVDDPGGPPAGPMMTGKQPDALPALAGAI